jgi:Fe-S-cluster-containing dehydrogenase component/formate-dependent nitrite reductase membrane component NrfD
MLLLVLVPDARYNISAMNYGFIIDNRKCIGCHACTVACKQEHDLPIGVNRTWVKYVEKGEFPSTRRIFSVQRCNHCANAPCVEICPVTALWQRKDGIVDFSGERCIGCKACMQACPYDAIYIHPDDLTAAKCNYCAHRVEVGLAPPCVNVCPEHAIIAGDMEDPTTEISRMLSRHQVQVRKPEKGTLPKVFYIEGDTASLRPTFTQTQEGYLWSEIPKRVYQIAPPRLHDAESEARRVYDQGQSHTESWGAKVATYLWTKSIAAGIPLAAWLANMISGASPFTPMLNVVTILFLAITAALLVADLKQPKRFHWIILRPQWKSWLARGAFILMGYGILVGLDLLVNYLVHSEVLTSILFLLTIIFAIGSSLYSAFLFWQAKGRDFWQSPLFAVHLIVMAFVAGSAAIICLDPDVPAATGILIVAIVLHAAVITLDAMAVHGTRDAKIAARSMHHNNWMFWIGAVLVGMILPLALLHFGIWRGAGIAALVGLLIYERVWIRAGQIVPLS